MSTTTIPTRNPSPKTRFLGINEFVKAHTALMDQQALDRAIDFALLQYQRDLASEGRDNFNLAASAHFKMMGAQEFLNVLRHLAHQPSAPTIVDRDNLKH